MLAVLFRSNFILFWTVTGCQNNQFQIQADCFGQGDSSAGRHDRLKAGIQQQAKEELRWVKARARSVDKEKETACSGKAAKGRGRGTRAERRRRRRGCYQRRPPSRYPLLAAEGLAAMADCCMQPHKGLDHSTCSPTAHKGKCCVLGFNSEPQREALRGSQHLRCNESRKKSKQKRHMPFRDDLLTFAAMNPEGKRKVDLRFSVKSITRCLCCQTASYWQQNKSGTSMKCHHMVAGTLHSH